MNWMQHRADSKLEARLDINDYNEASLIEIKVPLDLPYQNDWKDFERYDGEVTVDGQHYKYVKRKVQDGMMVLKCIPNESKRQIESARDHFFQFANDLQNNSGEKKSDSSKPSMAKNNITECEEFTVFSFETTSTFLITSKQLNSNNNFIATCPHSSPEQPPEA
jgi:hypothetical protein